jgi:hypothetical protein
MLLTKLELLVLVDLVKVDKVLVTVKTPEQVMAVAV